MLTPRVHGSLLDAIPDESVNHPVGRLVRGGQLFIPKDPDLVLNDPSHRTRCRPIPRGSSIASNLGAGLPELHTLSAPRFHAPEVWVTI